MINPVPQTLINYRVYLDSVDLLGSADVDLPGLEAMTEEIKGAGIAGVADMPVLGHMNSTKLTINWRTITENMIKLAKQEAHQLDIRGAIQQYDSGEGKFKSVGVKVVCKAIPKNTGLGKMDAGAKMEAPQEFELTYVKLTLDEKELLEMDKFNFIYKVEGDDQLADVRANLGLSGWPSRTAPKGFKQS